MAILPAPPRRTLPARLLRLGAGEGGPPARVWLRCRGAPSGHREGGRGERGTLADGRRRGLAGSGAASRSARNRDPPGGGAGFLMRLLLIVFDGLADRPAPELDGKTPLEAARTPNLDRLAAGGIKRVLPPTSPRSPPDGPLRLWQRFVRGREEECRTLAAAIAEHEIDGLTFRYTYSGRGDG